MALAIQTAVIPASNTKPRRIKAWTCNGHRIVRTHPDLNHDEESHFTVALELVRTKFTYAKPEEYNTMCFGGTERGYVFVPTFSTLTNRK